jgi:hypothetical protein
MESDTPGVIDLSRFTVRPARRPGIVVGVLLATFLLWLVGAVADTPVWLTALLVPGVFIACYWGYGDSLRRSLASTFTVLGLLALLMLLFSLHPFE